MRGIDLKVIDALGLLFTVMIAGAIGYYSFAGASKESRLLHQEHHDLTERLILLRDMEATLGEGEDLLEALNAKIEELHERLPNAMEFADFYQYLSESAGQARVTLGEIRPGTAEEKEDFTVMSATISAIAPFEALYHFLSDLRRSPRMAKLSLLEIRPMEEAPLCEAQVVVKIYSLGGKR